MARANSYPEIRKYKLGPGEEGLNLLTRNYQHNAKKNDREFLLTADQFKTLTSSNCHYCGQEPNKECFNKNIKHLLGRERSKYVYNGIDRKDSDRGYVLDNCLPCCAKCNVSKMDTPYDDFILYLDRISSFRKGH